MVYADNIEPLRQHMRIIDRDIQSDYDTLPYPASPVPQSHPDHLATLAHLFGLKPPPPHTARILELGCATGQNLHSLALLLPNAHLHGVDLSPVQIESARHPLDPLQLHNLTFEARNLLELELEPASFDYILVHGVYSWVPLPVRERILALIQHALTPNGIALVTFNSFPGWHIAGLLRDIVLDLIDTTAAPARQIARTREVLAWIIASEHLDDNICGPSLARLARELSHTDDGYLFHEILTPINQPFYLKDFLHDASRHHLRYLTNAIPVSVFPGNFPHEILSEASRARDPIALQHILDLAQGRRFQNCCLIHDHLTPDLNIPPSRLHALRVYADLTSDPALDPSDPFTLQTTDGVLAALSGEHLRAAFSQLTRATPHAIPFLELTRDLDPETRDDLAIHLIRLHFSLAVSFSFTEPPITRHVTPHPRASPLARFQAPSQPWVSTLFHRKLFLNEPERDLLQRLDGHTRLTELDADAAVLKRFAQQALLMA